MHPPGVRNQALALIASGLNDCEVARRLGVPRTTVRDWRRPTYAPKGDTNICPRWWRASPRRIVFTDGDYAELLGLYLGDGHIISLYCTHLACLFPQHGAGRKHNRPSALENWQRSIVERKPWPFIRGLIRSDGCVFVNRTGPYEYVSYDFANHSADILELFTDAVRPGRCRVPGVREIRPNLPPRERGADAGTRRD